MALIDRNILLRKLNPGDISTTQQRLFDAARIPGTCQWFLDHEKTKDWLNGHDCRVLWLHGPSATGKTFISSSLVNHVLKNQGYPNVGVAAFQFSRRDPQLNLADYDYPFRSIARQLVSQLPPESPIIGRVRELNEEGFDVKTASLVLKELANVFEKMVIIFDGILVSNEVGLPKLMKYLLGGNNPVPGLRIMMMTRTVPSNALTHQFPSHSIEARASRKDLSLYSARAIDESPVNSSVLDDSHTKLFPYQKFFDMADGVFLPFLPSWFTNIASQPNQVLLKLVESWSPDSNMDVPRSFCETLVNEIKSTRHADMILCVLYHLVSMDEAHYTFTLPMLCEALDTWDIRHEDNKKFTAADISEACAHLVFIDNRMQALKIRSPLLIEYLRLEVFGHEYESRRAIAAFKYLSRDELADGHCNSSEKLKERLKANPYLCYAAKSLSVNVAGVAPGFFDSAFLRLTSSRGLIASYNQARHAWDFFDEVSYDECEADYQRWNCFIQGYSPLHVAAELGAGEAIIQTLVDRGDDLEACAENGQTALHIASEGQDVSNTLKRLLECGSNVASVDREDRTPLSHAMIYGCVDSVKLLLEHGADINAVDEEDRGECSREEPEIAQFLRELGVEMPADESDSDSDSDSE